MSRGREPGKLSRLVGLSHSSHLDESFVNLFLQVLRAATTPLVVAHRGASAVAPENTIAAAERAWSLGAAAWEFDVHLTRDRVPIVIHDASLLRTTNVAQRFLGDPRGLQGFLVSQFDFDEIQALDAGSWFLADPGGFRTVSHFRARGRLSHDDLGEFQSGTVRVPSLAEALELTLRRGWLANVEVKSFPNLRPELLEVVMAEVDRQGASDRVLVSSFHHEDAARAGRWRPSIATGVLFDSPLYRPSTYIREIIQADCAHPSAEALGGSSDAYRDNPGTRQLRGDLVQGLREDDVPVLVYTVNDPAPGGLAEHLAGVGVSGLFTDDPEAILSAQAR